MVNWFDLSSQDMRMTNSIYLVTLRKDIISPFAKESDEEKVKARKRRICKYHCGKTTERKKGIKSPYNSEKVNPKILK